MRTLIISDIHANLTARKAVLEDAKPYDQVWCLGDVIGYGPDPNECVELLRTINPLKCIKGNHDAAILGEIDIGAFNYEAQASLRWLRSEIRQGNLRWLRNLEESLAFDEVTLVHGSPRNPIWEYLMDPLLARENMRAFSTKVCLVGHTHIPCVFHVEDEPSQSTKLYTMSAGDTFTPENKAIINPGSVGQPRDNDPRSSYMIYDDEEEARWEFYRVSYDIEKVAKRIMAAGLPHRHATRLAKGW